MRLPKSRLPKFSIVIPTLNEERNLPRLLKDIRKQTLQPDEIIVADNRSTDKTRAIAKANRARIVKGGRWSIGRNNGIKAAKNDIIFLFDADSRIPNEFLRPTLEAFVRKRLDFSTVRYMPDSKKLRYKTLYGALNIYTKISPYLLPIATAACMITRKKAWKAVKGFDVRPDLICDDSDYAQRVVKAGFKYRAIAQSSVVTSVRRFEKKGYWRTLRIIVLSYIRRAFTGRYHDDLDAY